MSMVIFLGTRGNRRMPHPTLIGGKDPQVIAAGMIDIRGGKIYSINNSSGHHKLDKNCLEAAELAFQRIPNKLFQKIFRVIYHMRNRRKIMDYMSTWGYCRDYYELEDLIHRENRSVLDSSERVIFECVGSGNDMLVLQYEKEKIPISLSLYEMVAEPRYRIGEEVYIPGIEKNGKIITIAWNLKNQIHMYILRVVGEKNLYKYDSFSLMSIAKFQLGEEVYIPRKGKNGKIIEMIWHYKNQAQMYFLEIDGKKNSRRYYENELRKV